MLSRPAFYRQVLTSLASARVPFLIGGAYALGHHLGIDRGTKDLDLLICEEDWPAVAQILRARGIATRLMFPHWLGKALALHAQVDIIFNGGNGATPVSRDWFTSARPMHLFDRVAFVCPPEELLWSKAFVMERERFDGADVVHLLHALADRLDWVRLCRRFQGHEPVLRAHLLLYGYIFPGDAGRVPAWVDRALSDAARAHPAPADLCRGTLLSRAQYLSDVEEGGYRDARLPPFGGFSDRAWLIWTNAIDSAVSRVRPGRRTSTPRRKSPARPVPVATSEPASPAGEVEDAPRRRLTPVGRRPGALVVGARS